MDYNSVLYIESLVIVLVGSLLHFTYAWSGRNKFVAIFSAVNESTWEHIKLALSAIFLCTLVDVWFLGDNPNYWLARSISFVMPVVVIPLIFYTYTAFTKHPILCVDITSFVIAAVISTGVFVSILQLPAIGFAGNIVSMVISVIIIAMYLLLTRFPMHNFLFEDPITHQYGYDGHDVNRQHKLRRRSAGRQSTRRKSRH